MRNGVVKITFPLKLRRSAKTCLDLRKGMWAREEAELRVGPEGFFMAEVKEVPDVAPAEIYKALRLETAALLSGMDFYFSANYSRGYWPTAVKWLCVSGGIREES